MGEKTELEKNEASSEVEKKENDKHEDVKEKQEKGDEKSKDKKKKKKKDKDGEGQEDKENGVDEKKKKNPQDKNDAGKLKLKLEKIDAKMQALRTKREEILKQLEEAEKNGKNSNGEGCATPTRSSPEDSLVK